MSDPKSGPTRGGPNEPDDAFDAVKPPGSPQPTPGPPPAHRAIPSGTAAHPLAILAYDSAKERLKSQDTTLGNLRTRSTTLLSSAAVLTTVAAAIGLLYTDPSKGPVLEEWASWLLMVLVAGNGLCALFIVWPTSKWVFVPSPHKLLEYLRLGEDETVARLGMIEAIREGRIRNDAQLNRRVTAFRVQVATLVAEVLALLYALTRLQ